MFRILNWQQIWEQDYHEMNHLVLFLIQLLKLGNGDIISNRFDGQINLEPLCTIMKTESDLRNIQWNPYYNEYIERIHKMSYSSLSDNGMLQIFSFLILNMIMELFETVPAYSWLFIFFCKYWNLRNIV